MSDAKSRRRPIGWLRPSVLATTSKAVLAAVALAQESGPRKQFKAPELLPLVNPIVSKDEGCAKDLAKGMIEMDGLARQKHFTELFAYGCTRLIKGTYKVKLTALRTIKIGNEQVVLNGVDLLGIAGEGSTSEIIHGWVLARQLTTTWDLQQALEAAFAAAVKQANK